MNELTSFEFHPNARVSIDERARNLLARIKERKRENSPGDFPSQRHISAHITDKDIVGEPLVWTTDGLGTTLSVAFSKGNQNYEISDDSYTHLKSIVNLVLKTKWAFDTLSDSFIEIAIVDWCRTQIGSSITDSFCDFVSAECGRKVKEFDVWIPIAELEVERTFNIGPVRIDTITKEMMDRFELKAAQKAGKHKDTVAQGFIKLRKDIQGLAAAILNVRAEPTHAFNHAIEIAETAIGLLRCFSLAAITPREICPIAVLGSEYIPRATALILEDDKHRIRRSTRRRPNHWRISVAQLNDMESRGLQPLGHLVFENGLTEFQSTLRSSLLAFSKSLTLPDINDRLVYTMSSLEGLLLDDNEPIQQNVAERLAFKLFKDPAARKETVRNFKAVYRMRSQYIHHRVSLVEKEQLDVFFRNAGLFLTCTLKHLSQFQTKREFLRAIDDIKFGTSRPAGSQ